MRTIQVLLQTTIPPVADDWSIARFECLTELLRKQRYSDGRVMFNVVARDRDPLGQPDSILSRLDETEFDELWLFAVDEGNGLTSEDCGGITRFRRQGRGLLTARDHMDLGCSLCSLGGVGKAHHFHTHNPGMLFVLDSNSGKLITTFKTVNVSDDMTFNAAHHRLIVSGADGLDVFAQENPDQYRLVQHVDTLGGKTSVYVPSLKRFYVVHTKGEQAPEAGLQIFKVND
jgi:hypothetical protein